LLSEVTQIVPREYCVFKVAHCLGAFFPIALALNAFLNVFLNGFSRSFF
jgi:hypothetical protein